MTDAPNFYAFTTDSGNGTGPVDPSGGVDGKGPLFWVLLFGFLNHIVSAISGAIQGFYDLFVSCFTTYVTFELEMTKLFCGLPRVEILCLLLTAVVLVNSALFWASRFMALVLPWGTPGKRAAAWGRFIGAGHAAEKVKQAYCCGVGEGDERRGKVEHLL